MCRHAIAPRSLFHTRKLPDAMRRASAIPVRSIGSNHTPTHVDAPRSVTSNEPDEVDWGQSIFHASFPTFADTHDSDATSAQTSATPTMSHRDLSTSYKHSQPARGSPSHVAMTSRGAVRGSSGVPQAASSADTTASAPQLRGNSYVTHGRRRTLHIDISDFKFRGSVRGGTRRGSSKSNSQRKEDTNARSSGSAMRAHACGAFRDWRQLPAPATAFTTSAATCTVCADQYQARVAHIKKSSSASFSSDSATYARTSTAHLEPSDSIRSAAHKVAQDFSSDNSSSAIRTHVRSAVRDRQLLQAPTTAITTPTAMFTHTRAAATAPLAHGRPRRVDDSATVRDTCGDVYNPHGDVHGCRESITMTARSAEAAPMRAETLATEPHSRRHPRREYTFAMTFQATDSVYQSHSDMRSSSSARTTHEYQEQPHQVASGADLTASMPQLRSGSHVAIEFQRTLRIDRSVYRSHGSVRDRTRSGSSKTDSQHSKELKRKTSVATTVASGKSRS
ncbi:hypothetical protein EDB85DRAFT_1898364 [Lactarius pseudohatsudake]|nr:hypothetical protein EDB85DRAFT_1898364 [Lactarius pseudohatsudake]